MRDEERGVEYIGKQRAVIRIVGLVPKVPYLEVALAEPATRLKSNVDLSGIPRLSKRFGRRGPETSYLIDN